jgi:hypothetical protein
MYHLIYSTLLMAAVSVTRKADISQMRPLLFDYCELWLATLKLITLQRIRNSCRLHFV